MRGWRAWDSPLASARQTGVLTVSSRVLRAPPARPARVGRPQAAAGKPRLRHHHTTRTVMRWEGRGVRGGGFAVTAAARSAQNSQREGLRRPSRRSLLRPTVAVGPYAQPLPSLSPR